MSERYSSFEKFGISQINAASDAHRAIQEYDGVEMDESLIAVKETDIYRLRRGLCLPSAAATCINTLYGDRVIGDDDGQITVGDMYRILMPFHNRTDLVDNSGREFGKPWFVVTPQGDMYHHAIAAFSEGMQVHSSSIQGFESVSTFDELIDQGGSVAISLDNTFILDHTLANQPELLKRDEQGATILIEGPDGLEHRRFRNGRHVVSIVGRNNGSYVVHESFRLPQMGDTPLFMDLNADDINPYLTNSARGVSRAIAFSRDGSDFPQGSVDVFVPVDVINRTKAVLESSKFITT